MKFHNVNRKFYEEFLFRHNAVFIFTANQFVSLINELLSLSYILHVFLYYKYTCIKPLVPGA